MAPHAALAEKSAGCSISSTASSTAAIGSPPIIERVPTSSSSC
jgi:hypothetical protein